MTGRFRLVLIGWLVAASLAATPAYARRKKTPIQIFNVTEFGGRLSGSSEFYEKKQNNSVTHFKLTERRKDYGESIEFNTGGYFYHPNLVDWLADVSFNLEQQREATNGQDRNSDGTMFDYNVSAVILKAKPLSFRIFAVGSQSGVRRNFSGSYDQERRNVGVEAYTKGRFPASLLLEAVQRDEIDDIRAETQRTKHLAFRIADERDPDWLTEFTFDREDNDESFDSLNVTGAVVSTEDLSYVRNEFTVSNNWRFGQEDGKHSLSGGVRVLRRRGFFFNRAFSAGQRLELQHTDTFTTYYSGRYSTDETDTENEKSFEGEVGFTQRIYDSLDIEGQLYLRDRTFVDGIEDIRGAFLDMDYRKITPIGDFTSTLRVGREYENETSSTGRRTISNESVDLTGGGWVTLSEAGVVGLPIVTNVAGTVVYDPATGPGADYEVRTIGVTTEIRLVPGGDIDLLPAPKIVHVDYTVSVGRDSEFLSDRVTWGNRLQLKQVPVAVYVDYSLDDKQLESGGDPGNLETDRIWLVGMDLAVGGFSLTLEHEDHDQKLSPPSVSTRVIVKYDGEVGSNISFAVGADAEWRRYRQSRTFGLAPGRQYRDSYGVFARLTAMLGRNALLNLDSEYTQSRGEDNDNLGRVGLSFEWKYRDLDFSVEASHDVFRQESNFGTEDILMFSMSRLF